MSDMTRLEMRSLIQRLMGDDNGIMFPNTLVDDLINRAQQEIARDLEAIVKSTTISALNADGGFDLPSDFIQVKRLLWDGQPLLPQSYEYMANRQIPEGTPFAYYIVGQSLMFFPQPTAVGTSVSLQYVSSPANLTSDGATSPLPDTAVRAMIFWVVQKLKLRDEDYEGYQLMNTEYATTVAQGKFDRTMSNADSFTGIRPHESYSHGGDSWLF